MPPTGSPRSWGRIPPARACTAPTSRRCSATARPSGRQPWPGSRRQKPLETRGWPPSSTVRWGWTPSRAAGEGRVAADHLRVTLAAALDLGILEPNWIRVEADLVEALAGAGDPDDAAAALIAFDGRAATARLPWAVTAVARSRAVGRLAADDPAGALAALDEAAGASTALPLAVERGRFHLVRGAALRRLRRIREHGPRSSRRLRCSRRTGSAVEAGPGRARPPRRPGGSGLALTPAEHQVAALAAAGRSNRESRRCSS